MAIRFLVPNLWATVGTLTASSEATGFEVENTATRHFLERWRSTGLTAEWVKCDLGAAMSVNSLAIRASNLRVGDSLSIQANDTDDWGSPPVNQAITITATMVAKELIIYNATISPNRRWWRILMTATAHPDGYIRIGRVCLGTYVEPDRDYDKDFEVEDVDPSVVISSATNQKYVNVLPAYKRIRLNFTSISAADAVKFKAIRDEVGRNGTFHVELDPANNLVSESYYVSCTSGWNLRHIYGGQLYSMALTMEQER